MARALAKKAETSTTLLEAAKKVLRQNGHSGLSTRDVAAAAGVPLSQIHYHFGSKQGLMLALFDYLNTQLWTGRTRCSTTPRSACRSAGTARVITSTRTLPRATCASCRN